MNTETQKIGNVTSLEPVKSDTLIIYHYFEKDSTYIENFLHFLIFGYSEENDYLVLIAGECTIELPKLNKLTYFFTKNMNYDYGGYCEAINKYPCILGYEFIFFINSSVRGPFMPSNSKQSWTSIFRDKITSEIGLIGTTINILPTNSPPSREYRKRYGGDEPYSHVQTMAYAVPQKTFKYLYESGFYEIRSELTKEEVIEDYELRLSQVVLSMGLNIACLLPEYNKIDYRGKHQEINPTSRNGDVCYPNAYFGRSAHPFEVIYIKTNREIYNIKYLERLAYSSLCNIQLENELLNQSIIVNYVTKLKSIPARKEVAHFSEVLLTPDEILEFTKILLTRLPQSRSRIEQLLNHPKSENRDYRVKF